MKKSLALVTNLALVLVLVLIGTVCFLPVSGPAAGVESRVFRKGEHGVSLMFNVYWGTGEVYGILDVLDEYDAKATFFLGGSWADDNVACVKEIAARGHEIGSHGYFHREHDKLSLEENVREIQTSIEFLSLVIGQPISLFAPPAGAYNDDTLTAAEDLGLKTILWSKDTIDWRDKDAALCYSRATEGAEAGDLILMHPMAHTLAALPKILQTYRTAGLSVLTVGENLNT